MIDEDKAHKEVSFIIYKIKLLDCCESGNAEELFFEIVRSHRK